MKHGTFILVLLVFAGSVLAQSNPQETSAVKSKDSASVGAQRGTLTDVDGNVYKTVKIGNQWWMAENLKVTRYRNGDSIPHAPNADTWSGHTSSGQLQRGVSIPMSKYDVTTGAYCNYNNDEGNVATYGRLYNWYAVADSRNIAPAGWHVPTDADWKQLEMYLGMSQAQADASFERGTDEGGKLKEADTTHWEPPNTGATNESGFSALPGGLRWVLGKFRSMGSYASFWSSTVNRDDSYSAWMECVNKNETNLLFGQAAFLS